ncbi:phosphoenolpyruvate phosphomutase-domain-containing protein [Halenospora varia]|nr:phosphoenolpyruvate phosphomutase-domain-containing protein [Halenospora varia]
MSFQAALATSFKSLHKPGNPILLLNVYDAVTAKAVAELAGTKALATASYAVAAAAGLEDDDMTFEINLHAVHGISKIAKQYNLPLTVDWQDGYGERLEEGIEKLLESGVVGINLEDYDKEKKAMIPVDVAAKRVGRVLDVAREKGIPDFVVNGRCDTLLHGGSIEDAIERGTAYLGAGATTAFVWGGGKRGGMSREEATELSKALGGRLNISMKLAPGMLTAKDLAEIGVARISVGPQLQFVAVKAVADEAARILGEKH